MLADTDADAHIGEMAAVKRELDTARDAVHYRAFLYCQQDGRYSRCCFVQNLILDA